MNLTLNLMLWHIPSGQSTSSKSGKSSEYEMLNLAGTGSKATYHTQHLLYSISKNDYKIRS